MTVNVAEHDLSAAIISSIKDGSFPDSEQVLTSELPATALPSILHEVSQARQLLEDEVCHVSQETASDVDAWIAHAKQLHQDIAESRAIAREVVKEHEAGKALAAARQDAKAKFDLLEEEIKFNNQITQAFKDLQLFDGELQSIQSSLSSNDPLTAAAKWTTVHDWLDNLRSNNGKRIVLDQARDVHKATLMQLEALLEKMFEFDRVNMPIDGVMGAFEQLGALDETVKLISKNINRLVLLPVIFQGPNKRGISVNVSDTEIDLTEKSDTEDVQNVLNNIGSILDYLHTNLPKTIEKGVAEAIIPEIVSAIISSWLTPCVPLELADIPKFEGLQQSTSDLARRLSGYGWPGSRALLEWVAASPRMWLTKRRMASLDGVRKALASKRGPSRIVERVERQVVSRQDAAFAVEGELDDWDSGWNDDTEASKPPVQAHAEEDDVSAWNFEDDEPEKDSTSDQSKPATGGEDADTADAWGWDEDDPSQSRDNTTVKPDAVPGKSGIKISNGNTFNEREVTLKETYTITDIPDAILEIIGKDMQETQEVIDSQYSALHGASPSSGLLALPTFVLAMFRATAPSYYMTTLTNGNMRLYNDSMYIVENLRNAPWSAEYKQVQIDCESLEKFARSAYAREMDVQRTVLADLLDGAQGFTSCTQFPYSKQCDDAVTSVIDRLREVYREWAPILSHSALLQSVGSLLSKVIEKMIQDIEDMEDITEPESQRLAAYCSQLSNLSDLFVPEKEVAMKDAPTKEAQDEEAVPLTALYVSNWLRFQYLANILESSLVDIKYLWTEGELSLEFSAEEVTDMIKALFSESANRRNAIADIRRSKSRASR